MWLVAEQFGDWFQGLSEHDVVLTASLAAVEECPRPRIRLRHLRTELTVSHRTWE